MSVVYNTGNYEPMNLTLRILDASDYKKIVSPTIINNNIFGLNPNVTVHHFPGFYFKHSALRNRNNTHVRILTYCLHKKDLMEINSATIVKW